MSLTAMGEPRDPRYPPGKCNTFWGSHGCDLLFGHDGPCVCGANDPDGLDGLCTEYTPGEGVRFYDANGRRGDELYDFDQPWGDAALPQPQIEPRST
jgi:hypothetical protein